MRPLLPLLFTAVAALTAAACAAPETSGSSAQDLTADAAAPAARATVCVVLDDNGDNIPFKKASTPHDHEYATLEVGDLHGVEFLLKAGHGVARLEATVNGKLVAATFFQTAVDTDSLRLDALAPGGDLVEAQCDGVNSAL